MVDKAVLRVDTKAEGLAVAVGGWPLVYDEAGTLRKDLLPWFHFKLTEQSAP